VSKDGGDDAPEDGSGPATYTYTVNNLNNEELGTNVPVTRPRPNGAMKSYESPGGGYGVAFYDGGLVLWDAGEVEETTPDCEDTEEDV